MDEKIQKWLVPPRTLLKLIGSALMILIGLQVLDVLSTIRFVRLYGIEMEENPLARQFFLHYGVAGLWLHKLLLLPFIISSGAILFQLSRKYASDRKNHALLIPSLSFFFGVCVYINIQFITIVFFNFGD